MLNPYKARKTLLSGTTSYFYAWQTLKLPVFNIILPALIKYVNHLFWIFSNYSGLNICYYTTQHCKFYFISPLNIKNGYAKKHSHHEESPKAILTLLQPPLKGRTHLYYYKTQKGKMINTFYIIFRNTISPHHCNDRSHAG